MKTNYVYEGDCIEGIKKLPDNSVDAIITDPPYELGFMGKSWDNTGIANSVELWKECLRVLKPGGHLLAFSGTRTYHRMAVAIEDAGFEVRDMIEWIYGSGFPKSLNIGKAVDKLQGNEREKSTYIPNDKNKVYGKGYGGGITDTSKGTSEWEGWGTALKPAHEPICMARKPLAEKTVAKNVLKWGTGGINIDESRVEGIKEGNPNRFKNVKRDKNCNSIFTNGGMDNNEPIKQNGRFPANLIHDNSEEVRECFPDAKGASSQNNHSNGKIYRGQSLLESETKLEGYRDWYNDNGNASRFFKSIIYQAKASKSERNKGCEGLEEKERIDYGGFHSEKGLIENNRNPENRKPTTNNHPTVKPIALMEYLIKMVTPKGGLVLDPFMGSGTTVLACINLGRDWLGIEREQEYVKIAKARINYFENTLGETNNED